MKLSRKFSLIFFLILIIPGCKKDIPVFDGNAAFDYLTAQTDIGTREPGSEGHKKCLDYLVSELMKTADLVNVQPFSFKDEFLNIDYELSNIIASYNLEPKGGRRILLMAHWDTRPMADEDPDPENFYVPILGANDGASGVAVLLQLGKIMKENPPPFGVDIVLFDGEDYGDSEVNDLDYYFLGSRHFAETRGNYKPEYGILLDMVGGKDAVFYKEGYSLQYAPFITDKIWDIAGDLGYDIFVNEPGPAISDDHWIINQSGIPSVDIIDINDSEINFKEWHTISDTPDVCSPETLFKVGTVLLHLIYG
ncbi:M28 family peptidase [candidate division KSB1 bacterium]